MSLVLRPSVVWCVFVAAAGCLAREPASDSTARPTPAGPSDAPDRVLDDLRLHLGDCAVVPGADCSHVASLTEGGVLTLSGYDVQDRLRASIDLRMMRVEEALEREAILNAAAGSDPPLGDIRVVSVIVAYVANYRVDSAVAHPERQLHVWLLETHPDFRRSAAIIDADGGRITGVAAELALLVEEQVYRLAFEQQEMLDRLLGRIGSGALMAAVCGTLSQLAYKLGQKRWPDASKFEAGSLFPLIFLICGGAWLWFDRPGEPTGTALQAACANRPNACMCIAFNPDEADLLLNCGALAATGVGIAGTCLPHPQGVSYDIPCRNLRATPENGSAELAKTCGRSSSGSQEGRCWCLPWPDQDVGRVIRCNADGTPDQETHVPCPAPAENGDAYAVDCTSPALGNP